MRRDAEPSFHALSPRWPSSVAGSVYSWSVYGLGQPVLLEGLTSLSSELMWTQSPVVSRMRGCAWPHSLTRCGFSVPRFLWGFCFIAGLDAFYPRGFYQGLTGVLVLRT